MNRGTIAALVAIVAVATVVAADEKSSPLPPPVRLQVSPAAAPAPALRYRLLPEVRDQNPGNAAQSYYRSLNAAWLGTYQREPKEFELLLSLARKPLRDFTPADVAAAARVRNSKALADVDRGARRPYCDWELADPLRAEGIELPLPEVQLIRTIATLVQLRAKLELRDRKFDEAARSVQTSLALARHVADGSTLIQSLVGFAIAGGTLEALDDWVSVPGAPNLYWALTNLPRPLIDARKGFEGERVITDNILPGYREMLDDPTAPAPSAAQLQRNLRRYMAVFGESQRDDVGRGATFLALALRDYPEAKRRLRDLGYTAAQVDALPVLHVVFLYQIYKYDVGFDEMRKWIGQPFPEAAVKTTGQTTAYLNAHFPQDLAEALIPAVYSVFAARARIDRKIAALRCVEAVRMYAAAHGGKLPDTLSDVTEVPVPGDPMSGMPFSYTRDGDRAILTSAASPGGAPRAQNRIHYEISVRAAKE